MATDNAPITVDLLKQNKSAWLLPFFPALSSDRLGWEGFSLAYFQVRTSHEIPEVSPLQHVLTIAGDRTRLTIQCRLDGRFQRFAFHSGKSTITPAGTSYSSTRESGGNFLLLALHPDFVKQTVRESIDPDKVEIIPQFATNDFLIQQVGVALIADLESGCSLGRLYGESLATTLAIHLLKNYSARKPDLSACDRGLENSRLQKAIDYIHAHLYRDLTLSNIANTVGISQYYFCRLFKQSTGNTVYQYLLQQRVERAKLLLKQQKLSIADIALQCGFADQSHFTKNFRKLTGMTPKCYRNILK